MFICNFILSLYEDEYNKDSWSNIMTLFISVLKYISCIDCVIEQTMQSFADDLYPSKWTTRTLGQIVMFQAMESESDNM